MNLFNIEIDKSICYFLLTFLFAYYWHKYTWGRRAQNLPPGPWAMPFLGHIVYLYQGCAYRTMAGELRKKYGDVLTLYAGNTPAIVINDYSVAVEALVSKYPNELAGRIYMKSFNRLTRGVNDILQADPSSKWNLHRQIAHNAIRRYSMDSKRSAHNIKQAVDVVRCELDRSRADQTTAEPVDLREIISSLIYNNICGMVYGTVYTNLQENEFVMLRNLLNRLIETITKYFILMESLPFVMSLPLPPFRRFSQDMKVLNNFIQTKLDQHRTDYKSDNLHDVIDFIFHENENHQSETNDITTRSIGDGDIRMIILDMFIAGTESISNSVYWLIGLLAKHPDVQERLFNEINNYIQTSCDRNESLIPNNAWKLSLPYSNAVLHEVLRYSAVAARGMPHRALENCTIGGYDIPKDAEVHTNIYAFHFDPKYWGEDAHLFRPERFLIEKRIGGEVKWEMKPKCPGLAPFGLGRRMCLGEMSAKNSIYLFMLNLCLAYKFEAASGEGTFVIEEKDDCLFDRSPKSYKVLTIPRNAVR